jgi:flagellar protein FlaG
MEVKELFTAVELNLPELPEASLNNQRAQASPHTDVRADRIGKEKAAGQLFKEEENTKDQILEALRKFEAANINRKIALNWWVDETTEDVVVQVVERDTEKVIRQIPPEEVLRMRGRLQEFLGVFFDQNG